MRCWREILEKVHFAPEFFSFLHSKQIFFLPKFVIKKMILFVLKLSCIKKNNETVLQQSLIYTKYTYKKSIKLLIFANYIQFFYLY